MNKEKTIYNIKLHEDLSVSPSLQATKVPGGWIYRYWNYENQDWFSNCVFVPFHREYSKSNN